MAASTGVNISKAVAFAVVNPPGNVNISKALAYAVLYISVPNTNPPVWPSFTFGNGVVGVAYSQTWDLYPAAAPTTYTLVSGTLPTGLSLSNVTADQGQISGTPSAAGTYSFTLRATNAYGTADKPFTITISTSGGGSGATNYGYVS